MNESGRTTPPLGASPPKRSPASQTSRPLGSVSRSAQVRRTTTRSSGGFCEAISHAWYRRDATPLAVPIANPP
ncbi:MAG: hypothetical protein AAF108_08605 [Planctomycetota bacterium]